MSDRAHGQPSKERSTAVTNLMCPFTKVECSDGCALATTRCGVLICSIPLIAQAIAAHLPDDHDEKRDYFAQAVELDEA